MATEQQVRLTYQDYLDMPESDDRYELIDGELYMAPTPIPEHQIFLFYLAKVVEEFVTRNRLGRIIISPQDVIIHEDIVVQPDMMFVSNERMHIIKWGHYVQGTPDLVVEVLSPSTARYDRTLKRERYAQFGVREYWIVDIVARTIEVNVSDGSKFTVDGVYGEGETVKSPLLSGLEFDIYEVFESANL